MPTTKDSVLSAFKRFDTNGDGCLSEKELSQILVGVGVNPADVPLIFAKSDTNSDGLISYEEFLEWIYTSAPRPVAKPLKVDRTQPVDRCNGVTHILVDQSRVVTRFVGGYPVLPSQLPMIEDSWSWIRSGNDAVHRATRLDAGKLIREAFAKGGYIANCGGQLTKAKFMNLKGLLEGTAFITSKEVDGLPDNPHRCLLFDRGRDVLSSVLEFTARGCSTIALNAASAYHPGGGFTTGGRHALEEATCSQSTLYPSLEKVSSLNQFDDATARKYAARPYIPHDSVIFSPGVEIFRRCSDQGYQLHPRPTRITGIISLAMFNLNPKVRDSPVDAPSDKRRYEDAVKLKFTLVARTAAKFGAEALVFPDVGCGAFGNDPTIVGRLAGIALVPYIGYFKHIVFTGRREFFDAASAAIAGGSGSSSLRRANKLSQRDIDLTSGQHFDDACIVCGKSLGMEMSLLIDPVGEPSLHFLHTNCTDLLSEKRPRHTAMALPPATNAESFFAGSGCQRHWCVVQGGSTLHNVSDLEWRCEDIE